MTEQAGLELFGMQAADTKETALPHLEHAVRKVKMDVPTACVPARPWTFQELKTTWLNEGLIHN